MATCLSFMYWHLFVVVTWASPTGVVSNETASPIPTNLVPSTNSTSFSCPISGSTNQRSLYSIIWSCSVTVSICTWVAFHPGIPAQGTKKWVVTKNRILIMCGAIFAPELVIYGALREWRIARRTAKQWEYRGWTMTHGFFLEMGGFMLYEEGEPTAPLTSKEFEPLVLQGLIDFPSITEEEIEDRNKSDLLSKALVVVQSSWFIVQCIARGAQGLVLTELELSTLAFAVLNALVYYFWWYKPQDVHCPIPVHLKRRKNGGAGSDGAGSDASPEESDYVQNKSGSSNPDLPSLSGPPSSSHNYTRAVTLEKLAMDTSEDFPMELAPFPLSFITRNKEEKMKLTPFITATIAQRSEPISPSIQIDTTSIRRHRSHPYEAYMASLGILVAGILFGALHFIAWSFSFPSDLEQLCWRIAAMVITILPLTLLIIFCIFTMTGNRMSPWIKLGKAMKGMVFSRLMGGGIALYIIARIILIVLSFTCLRDLPEGAFVDVQWSKLFPHSVL